MKTVKKCLEDNGVILRSQKKKKTKSAVHNVFAEKVNKIALSCNGDNH